LVLGFKKERGVSEARVGSDLLQNLSGKYYFWGFKKGINQDKI